jgi:Flp pilus assembly secretin CpaC
MRKAISSISVFLAVAGFVAASAAVAQSMRLEVDQSQPLRFNAPITGVVVGNAGIADVIVHDSKTLLVIGKSVGTTRVLAVDQRGRAIYSGEVQVRATDPQGLLTVQRGRELSTSLCDTRCVAYAHSESGTQGISDAVARASSRSAFASGGAPK